MTLNDLVTLATGATYSENKTAELSQRRPRDAPNMGALKSFESPHYAPGWEAVLKKLDTVENCRIAENWIRPHSIFSQNFKGLLFGWTL